MSRNLGSGVVLQCCLAHERIFIPGFVGFASGQFRASLSLSLLSNPSFPHRLPFCRPLLAPAWLSDYTPTKNTALNLFSGRILSLLPGVSWRVRQKGQTSLPTPGRHDRRPNTPVVWERASFLHFCISMRGDSTWRGSRAARAKSAISITHNRRSLHALWDVPTHASEARA